jgi:hypothetical protein
VEAAQTPRRRSLADQVADLLALAQNDEACRLLGVDGSLESQLDITFLDDPLDWLAFDIAQAIKAVPDDEEKEPGPTLTTLVAEVRLIRLMKGSIDQARIERLVHDYLLDSDD